MKARVLWRVAVPLLFLLLILMAVLGLRSSKRSAAKSHNPDLEYLKAVNSVAPPKDPELMFILMTQFANSNLQGEGAAANSLAIFVSERPHRMNSPGVLSTQTNRLIQPGCARSTFTSANLP